MVVRVWHGVVAADKGEEYLRYLGEFGVEDYKKYPGCKAAYLLHRRMEERVHVLFLSFWESREAIAAYAGNDIGKARYYAYDLECLINPPADVELYEISAASSFPS
jgi:heme-degrading monooxygenase HmoA